MHYNVFTGYMAEPVAFSETNATQSAYGKHKLLWPCANSNGNNRPRCR